MKRKLLFLFLFLSSTLIISGCTGVTSDAADNPTATATETFTANLTEENKTAAVIQGPHPPPAPAGIQEASENLTHSTPDLSSPYRFGIPSRPPFTPETLEPTLMKTEIQEFSANMTPSHPSITWITMEAQYRLPEKNRLYAVWASSSDDVFAVGADGVIVHYDGSSWTTMDSGTASYLRGVWGMSGSDVFAVGDGETILHYDGIQWSKQYQLERGIGLYGVWGASDNDIFAVGNGYPGTIVHYDGNSWRPMDNITTDFGPLNDVWGSSCSDVFAVGNDGVIVHYDGNNWNVMNSGTKSHLRGVWGTSGGDVFAVGGYGHTPNDGIILHYDGSSWSTINSGTIPYLWDVWGSSGADIFAVGGAVGTIVHYNGNKWSAVTGMDSLLGIWASPGSDLFTVGENGTILHFQDEQ